MTAPRVGPSRSSHASRRPGAGLFIVVILSCGCGRPAAIVAEPEAATAVLESVLAAWRDGETCAELRRRSPPIHVADERWLGGATLESFTIGPACAFGPSTRFEVTLVGPAPLGTRRVVYTVSTRPAISVALGD